MIKLAILVLLVGWVASDGMNLVSSQRAVIPHYSPYAHGNGISSRYFDKVETGLGLHGSRGMAYGGIHNLGLGYGRLGVGYGRLGVGYGRLGLGYGRVGYEHLGLGYGGLAY